MRETRLIGMSPACLLRGFPFPWWHGMRLRPQAFPLGPGQFFHVPKTLALGCIRSRPRQPLFDQLMPHIASVPKKNLCSGPAMPVPLESTDHNFAVAHISCDRVLRLFPVRLLEFGTIDIFEIDCLTTALVMDRQTIALVDGDDSRAKVSP